MELIETNNVLNVYSKIANHFDSTRYSKWNSVYQFIESIPSESKVLDLGCGNGKYLYRDDLKYTAIDNCPEFIDIVRSRYPDVLTKVTDVTQTGLIEEFDVLISIAVIHHLSSVERRKLMISEIYRLLKKDGIALITAWGSVHNERKVLQKSTCLENNDYLIPWNDKNSGKTEYRFYHLFEEGELESLIDNRFRIISTEFERDNWLITIQKL